MVKLKIDGTGFEAPEGSTILEIASDAGFSIPTMCHKKGIPHYSSCMVCMVKDKRTGNYMPSCSALVEDGMDLDISGEEVIDLRKKAIELLLSEHRAECEAPCRIVCPAGYNIPLMNRLFIAKDYDAVVRLVASEIKSGEIKCLDCPAYCENACRRKKIDIPVSIRNMKLFISEKINITKLTDTPSDNFVDTKPLKRFTSRIGKIEQSEQQEWLKECIDEVRRFREIPDYDSASSESESCMHCDCRASDDCRLRELADAYAIKDPRGKIVNSPIVKKINHNTGLVFENAKCIKCGLCVRICEDSTDEPSLCFMHRGFVSIISEPLTADFDDILKTRSKQVVDVCPTGALSFLK
jgi:predicted molibdopterin-dependent oxidoreductase YjgC